MIKAIFFDSEGVIVKGGFNSGIVEYEKKYNLPSGSLYASAHDRPYWKDFTLGNISEEEYFSKVKSDYSNSKLKIKDLQKRINQNFIPNTELTSFLRGVKDYFILGIISNNPKEWFERCAERFNWDDIFSLYAISGSLHIRKPDRGIFEYAVAKANVKPYECLYVDNRPDIVKGAEELGIKILIYLNTKQLISEINHLNV